jgi:hypothetical protein
MAEHFPLFLNLCGGADSAISTRACVMKVTVQIQ